MEATFPTQVKAKTVKGLRVLVCAFACHPEGGSGLGGGEDVLGWNMVRQIARFHQVWVLTHAGNRGGIERGLKRNPHRNVRFHYLGLPLGLESLVRCHYGPIQLYSYLWQIRALFVAWHLHRRLHFQLFHHVTYANDWMASFIGVLLPIPFVRGPGGGAHRIPKCMGRGYPLRARLWESVRSTSQHVFRQDPFFRMGQHRASAILVCNRESFAALTETWKQKAHLFSVNGVSEGDMTMMARVAGSTRKEKDRFEVLSAGALIRLKGFELAIQAFGIFVGRCPYAEFNIAGDGPELNHLKALVSALDLEDRVQFLGWLPRGELLSRMVACDAFLFASLRDGGGAVVVEAMAAGKPIICLDVGGPGIHVQDAWGIKVPPSSPEQAVLTFARALERLYEDRELCRSMGRRALEQARQVYHWDRLGERLLNIYGQALEHSGSRQDVLGR